MLLVIWTSIRCSCCKFTICIMKRIIFSILVVKHLFKRNCANFQEEISNQQYKDQNQAEDDGELETSYCTVQESVPFKLLVGKRIYHQQPTEHHVISDARTLGCRVITSWSLSPINLKSHQVFVTQKVVYFC